MSDTTREPATPAKDHADPEPRPPGREIAPTEPDPAEGANDDPPPRPGSPKG